MSPHSLPTQVVQNDIENLSSGSNAAQNATGPSFDCQKARDPVAATICSDPTLKLIDLEFNQAYQALRFQLPEDQRSTLRQDGIAFGQSMIEACQLPSKGVPNAATMARAVPCLAQAYRSKRTEYLGRLSSDAAQEAWRGMPRHIALQNRLVEAGMIAASGPVDGVYGSATRDAIIRFQTQQGLTPSGFMTDATADALIRPAHPDPDTTNADLETARKEVEATRKQIEESQKRIAAILAGDDASPRPDTANADLEAARKQADVEASRKQIEERRKAIAAALAEVRPSSRVSEPIPEKDRLEREAEQRRQKLAAEQHVREETYVAATQISNPLIQYNYGCATAENPHKMSLQWGSDYNIGVEDGKQAGYERVEGYEIIPGQVTTLMTYPKSKWIFKVDGDRIMLLGYNFDGIPVRQSRDVWQSPCYSEKLLPKPDSNRRPRDVLVSGLQMAIFQGDEGAVMAFLNRGVDLNSTAGFMDRPAIEVAGLGTAKIADMIRKAAGVATSDNKATRFALPGQPWRQISGLPGEVQGVYSPLGCNTDLLKFRLREDREEEKGNDGSFTLDGSAYSEIYQSGARFWVVSGSFSAFWELIPGGIRRIATIMQTGEVVVNPPEKGNFPRCRN